MPIGRHVSKLSGYAPALPTPFADDGRVDLEAFECLCARQVREGATALVVCSAAGEAWSLSAEEHRALVRVAVASARGLAVIAGASSNATAHAMTLAKIAEQERADAILSAVPYYNKPTQDGIVAHFHALAGSTGLPIIISDNPARSAVQLTDATIDRLATIPQIIGLEDGTGNPIRLQRLRRLVGDRFRLLCGDDTQSLAHLVNGADGCISITSNVAPGLCRDMFLAYRQGQIARAQRLSVPVATMSAALQRENSPAPVKFALALLGLSGASVRLPLVEAGPGTRAELEAIIHRIGELYPDALIAASRHNCDRLRGD